MNGLYYYKLVSPYPEDVTKNCKLTINEIDSNFFNLKSNDIKDAKFIREEKTLVLTRYNGEKLIVLLDDITYNFEAQTECGESGTTLVLHYDGKEGKRTLRLENILTVDNLMDVIGSDILTRVITDGTLKGDGTMNSPLGIRGVEKTGSLAPVLEVFDLTKGEKLPEAAKLGTRYITMEYVSDYGYLYNGAGVAKIQQKLDEKYSAKNLTEEEMQGAWRVPTKQDWDKLLNSVEPCDSCRTHGKADCHIELGCQAGKYLKSECGWMQQPPCTCNSTKPTTGCTFPDFVEEEQFIPSYDPKSPLGIDKFGMTVLPAGDAYYNDVIGRPVLSKFREKAFFWTTTYVHQDTSQDKYVKEFSWNKSGAYQAAQCPEPYYSVRLVKDYNGCNYMDSEYIDGVLYKTLLFPESGQIWLASNYADKAGFIEDYDVNTVPEVVNIDDEGVIEKRVEMFVNEWNGKYWEKRIMNEGETVVVQDPCFDQGTGETKDVCVKYDDYTTQCIEVFIPKVAQKNIEYRVFTNDEDCNKVLVNTDDLVVERVLNVVVPLIAKERWERIKADEALSAAIETEREERIATDEFLSGAIDTEREERIYADEVLSAAIETEIEERIAADAALSAAIDDERDERIAADKVLSAAIETEREERIAADEVLSAAIETEREERIAADEVLSAAIETEIEERIAADEFLSGAIDTEREERIAADEILDGQLIDWNKNPFTLSASTKDDYNMVLPSKDENEDHFIKIKFDGSFGRI
jgi:predicted RNase H-like nuclease